VDLAGALRSTERGAILPPGGKAEGRLELQLIRRRSGRIEQNGVPVEKGELGGGGRAARVDTFAIMSGGRSEIERGVHASDTGGDFHMEGPAILQVATPLELLTIRGEFEAG